MTEKLKDRNIFDQNTLVPVGIIATLLGAAFTFGVMYQRFTTLESRVQVVDERIVQLQGDFNRFFYPEKNQDSRTAQK